jgi:hypothetical protein
MVVLLIKDWGFKWIRFIYPAVFLLIVAWTMNNLYLYYTINAKVIRKDFFHKLETLKVMEQLRDKQNSFIIVPDYYGSPFIEYAHFFGSSYTSKHNKHYSAILKGLYPESIIYLPHVNTFYWFDEIVEPSNKLIENDVVLYLKNLPPEEREATIQVLAPHYPGHDFSGACLVFQNEATGETVWKIHQLSLSLND